MLQNEIVKNPEGVKEEYLKYLNVAFTNWGEEHLYSWVFDRQVGDLTTDQLIIKREGNVIAGSAVTYRKIALGGADIINVGIMTGSWTLPAARKTGCFTTIIEESKIMCRENKVPFLTAFVTDENPSSRRLAAAGALMIKSWNLFAPKEISESKNQINFIDDFEDKKSQEVIYQKFMEPDGSTVAYSYNEAEFIGQFIKRPNVPIILEVNGVFVIMEEGFNAMKILVTTARGIPQLVEVLNDVNQWCIQHHDKNLFFFTMDEKIENEFSKLGYTSKLGYYTVIDCDNGSSPELIEDVRINMGDKM
ncbi:hypothetical protein SAMN05192588_0376 [Nonlabens sp. Hel1_33_55]|uniref:hypothetical protein n=1 Tax=Nonlabens sp. Hel1_33_55 TaxID=1336802 RepID=UPI000875E4B0|nr:hypothetical protein [Nonlabens sp. Hel1_33_55]SCX94548.1 hypothetical protein SAMN05192588_0376 [Nonlabens sp. Hel1_33_55]